MTKSFPTAPSVLGQGLVNLLLLLRRLYMKFNRYKRECLYPLRRTSETAQTAEAVSPRTVNLNTPSRQPETVSVYFLDHEIFSCGQMEIPNIDSAIPSKISSILGDFTSIQETAIAYFRSVHCWWSLISQQSFYGRFMNPLVPRRGDIALLFLCMKLIVWRPSLEEPDPRTVLYFATKHYLMEIETAGTFNSCTLQSRVLIALYEVGQGIYPSALLTISSCARHGKALGVSLKHTADSRRSLNYFESEERRRAWWAILILDLFSNIGNPGRGFEINDQSPEDLLPADDTAWDIGMLSPDDEMTISCPLTARMGRFAKLAQATHLLHLVFQHVSDSSMEPAFRQKQALQLEKTLQASIRMFTAALKGPGGAPAMICYRYVTSRREVRLSAQQIQRSVRPP